MAALWFVVAALAIWIGSGLLDVRFLTYETTDVWFEADIARVFENMSDRWSNHFRANVHPIFALFVLPPVLVLRKLLGLDAWAAIRIVLATAGGLWASGLYLVLRLTGCRRLDASAFALVGVTSAGAMFWFVIPETHTIASLTIVLALLVVGVSAYRPVPELLESIVSASTFGVTVTNWMAGLGASFVSRSWRRTLQVSVNAFALAVFLWAVEKKFIPSTAFFLGNASETEHIMAPEALGPVKVAIAFFMHAVVMPAIAIVDRPGAAEWPIMIVQPSLPGSAGVLNLASSALWGALLLIGVWGLVRLRERPAMRLFLALFIAGQFALHQLFGNETFLYVPNFLPALIVLASLGALTPLRPVVLALAVLLSVTDAVNNATQWQRANRFLAEHGRFRHDARAARAEHDDALWPNGALFSRIPMPGARIFETPMISAGGSFSPGLDMFTISLWARDSTGAIVLNSDLARPDRAPAADGTRPDSAAVPTSVATPFYSVRWSPAGARAFRLQLTIPDSARVELVVRSVGARSAPVRHLVWDGARLLVNDRWEIVGDSTSLATAVTVHLADESRRGWESSAAAARELRVDNGWAAARLRFGAAGHYTLIVRDLTPDAGIDRPLVVSATAAGSPPAASARP